MSAPRRVIESPEYQRLIDKVNLLERLINNVAAQGNASQPSFDVAVVAPSYSHQHKPSALQSGDVSATLNFTTQPTGLIGSSIALDQIGSPTYTHTQHLQDVFHSAGWVSGGIISDAGGATVNITAGTGAIRSSGSAVANLLFFDWSAANGQAITANSIRYIGVEYNDGSPQIVIRTSNNFNSLTDFLLGTVVNESGTLHIQNTPHQIGDHAGSMINRMIDTARFARDSTSGGLILGESGDANRRVTMTAGSIWEGLTEFSLSAVDTNPGGGADTFDIYYDNNAGGFTKVADQTAWDMDSYDDGTGLLATLGNNKYGVLWFYIELDGEMVAMYGTSNAVSSAGAGIEAPPSTVPNRIQAHALLIGRIIFQKDTTPAIDVETVFTTTFSSIIATDHGNLAGLSDDDHTQYLKDLVDDTTPQLGGDLDLNGKNIDFPTTANISDCLDEDDMASNSAVMLATQQSIKAYVDAQDHSTGTLSNIVEDTTPQLGGDLDLNQKQISLNATALADHNATGVIITLTAASSGVTLGNGVYITSAGEIAKADADLTTTMPAIGIALETKTSAACQVLISGYMRDNTWAWTDGGVNGLIYVSTTAGAMTQTPPSGSGDQVQVIGHAVGADYILVMPSPVLVEVA